MSPAQAKQSLAYRHSPHVAWRKVGTEAVILDVDTAVYYTLKDAGLRIWELLEKKTPAQGIVEAVCQEFDGEPARVEKDLSRLLDKLAKERLIESA